MSYSICDIFDKIEPRGKHTIFGTLIFYIFFRGAIGGDYFLGKSQFFGGKIGKIPNFGAAGAKFFEKLSIF